MERRTNKKKELCSEIAAAIREVQKLYIASQGGTESGNNGSIDQQVTHNIELMCGTIEAVFLHELKSNGTLWRELRLPNPSVPPEPTFWVFIDPMVSDEIKMQLLALKNSDSDVRKCRSWVRLMLAKNMMITFLEDLQRHPGLLAFHYGGGAILRDLEQSEVIIQLLRGLLPLQLHYDHVSLKLDSWEPATLKLVGIWEGSEPDGAGVRTGKRTSGSSTPLSVASPVHSSPSTQRVSPPQTDFDFEGISIIDTALDKYSKRRATSSFSDSQLISKEIAKQSNPSPGIPRRANGSFSSLESGSSTANIVAEMEGQSGSYKAMLTNYAQRTGTAANSSREPLRRTQVNRERGGVYGGAGGGGEEKGPEEEQLEESGNEENYSVAFSLNYEIISSDGSLVESQIYEPHQQQKMTMEEHLFKLVNEKGLDSQKYTCYGCRRDIGIIFGQAKLCKFNGQHYCYDCHRDDERVIPARVLFNWDFRTHKVCMASCEFLDGVELSPVLDVEEINKTLYRYIPALEEALKLRQQCKHLKDYLITCKDADVVDQFRKRLKSSHICDDIHKYSIKDLMDVNSGTFNERIKKLVKFGIKHVKQCPLCSQKGFICEVCHSSQVLYPFDLEETYQCTSCKSVYHKTCHPEKASCPKCLRLRKRANSLITITD